MAAAVGHSEQVRLRLGRLAARPDRLDAWEAALLGALVKILDTRFAHRVVELLPQAPGMSRAFPSMWAADVKDTRIGIVVRTPEFLDDAGIERDVALIGHANAAAGATQTYLFMIDGAQNPELEAKVAAKAAEKLGKEAGLYVLTAFHEFGVPPPPPPREPCAEAARFVERMKEKAVVLNYEPSSLEAVDRLLVENAVDDAALDDAGMYVGEVMLKAHGGRWDETEMGRGVMFLDESMAFPTVWVRKFLRTKAENDRTAAKYDAIRRTLS